MRPNLVTPEANSGVMNAEIIAGLIADNRAEHPLGWEWDNLVLQFAENFQEADRDFNVRLFAEKAGGSVYIEEGWLD